MPDLWSPDFALDSSLVMALVGAQFPHLDRGDLQRVGAGWDHEVWRCGDVCFRFPHQRESLTAARDTADALARVAPLVPLAVPEPVLRGRPTADYPGHVIGYRWIAGELPARLPLTMADRAAAGPPLAAFLTALHAVPVPVAATWGLSVEGARGTMAERTTHGRQRADQLSQTAFADLADRAARAMVPPPPERAPPDLRLVHGDLHAGQLLFDAGHRLVGVIDWDSLAIGDPAFDLLLVFSFLPPAVRAAFWAAYPDRSAEARARHLALSYGLALLAQGVQTGDVGVRDEAAFSLSNALAD